MPIIILEIPLFFDAEIGYDFCRATIIQSKGVQFFRVRKLTLTYQASFILQDNFPNNFELMHFNSPSLKI
jgi:hypothetical protein